MPPYAERMYSIPTGPQWLDYINDQITFYSSLDAVIQNKVVCRIFPNEYGWNERGRLLKEFPKLKFDERKKSINKERVTSSLIIETCNQTTFLESLFGNYPTVIFWNKIKWEISDYAQPYIDELFNANILFYDPHKAAMH
mgnify:CR=1 FL=1